MVFLTVFQNFYSRNFKKALLAPSVTEGALKFSDFFSKIMRVVTFGNRCQRVRTAYQQVKQLFWRSLKKLAVFI
jgi:hypothetical protein